MSATERHSEPFWKQLCEVPPFLAMLRTVESRLIAELGHLGSRVLDLGCGDGHFASTLPDLRWTAGVDPDRASLRKAHQRNCHPLLAAARAEKLPFASAAFDAIVANSVLEHIPDVDIVLGEIYRLLHPGGCLVMTVPGDGFGQMLMGATLCRRAGLAGLAKAYENFFNRLSHHFHTDSPRVWQERLCRCGFAIEKCETYFSPRAHRIFDLMHYLSLPCLLAHCLTGRWVCFPHSLLNRFWYNRLKPYTEEKAPPIGAYLLIHAIKPIREREQCQS